MPTRLRVLGLTLLLVAAGSASLVAQGPPVAQVPSLSGRVLDASSMRPIAGAVVRSGDARAVTDAAGRFALALPRGEARLAVSADGYLPDEVQVTIGAAPVVVEVVLLSRAQFKEDVVVSGTTIPTSPSPSTIDVSPLQVRTVAGASENVFKVLQTLPGVNATADFDSRLSVRGGSPDQNLTIMDGIEIHDPYRLFGLAAAFNPETVENFQLTAGGFSPKYGDRLSSILLIENRAGTTTQRLRGTASVSFTDANVVVEGRLPGALAGSWIVTGRRTYYDLVADRITGMDLPSFGDLQAKTVWEIRPGRRLTFVALRSRENTNFKLTDSGTASTFGLVNAARNDLLSVSFVTTLGQLASSRTIVSWYRYGDGLGFQGDFRNEGARSNTPDAGSFGRLALDFTRDLSVGDVSVREEAGLKAGGHHFFETGFETHSLRTAWGWRLTGGRNLGEANGSSARGGAGLPSLLDSRQDTTRAGAWLVDRYQAASWMTLEPGLRVDWSGLARETVVSPRFSANIALRPNLRLRAAAGLYTQSPGYEKLLQADYFLDLTSATSLSIKSERAVHLLGAIERDLGHGLLARVEGYYKSYDRLIVGRLESPQETATRVALYEFPPAFASSVPSAPQITSTPVNGATGRSYGFDLYVSRRATSAADRFSGWASYTWGRADLDAYGRRFPVDYDRRHALSVVGTVRLTRLLELAATVRVASGFPYTPVQGLRVAALAITDANDQPIRYIPQQDANGLYVWTTAPGGVKDLNSGRLPLYARVDARVTFRPSWSNRRWQLYVEVVNALNRKNAGAFETKLEYDPGSDRPRLVQSPAAALPLLPSFGCRFSF
jgi:hypothetical protein